MDTHIDWRYHDADDVPKDRHGNAVNLPDDIFDLPLLSVGTRLNVRLLGLDGTTYDVDAIASKSLVNIDCYTILLGGIPQEEPVHRQPSARQYVEIVMIDGEY